MRALSDKLQTLLKYHIYYKAARLQNKGHEKSILKGKVPQCGRNLRIHESKMHTRSWFEDNFRVIIGGDIKTSKMDLWRPYKDLEVLALWSTNLEVH